MDATGPYHPPGEGFGLIDRSDRARVEVTGPDRAKFLHNLTTNEVKRLAAGRGCEAFVTSPQGKTIGYVILLAAEDRILVRSDPGGLELALAHLRKYGVFDDVTIEDRRAATFELHLLGAGCEDLVRGAGGPVPEGPDYAHMFGEIGRLDCHPVWVVRESPAGWPGLTLIGPANDAAVVLAELELASGVAGVPRLDPSDFEALRIEAGTPVFGKDVTEKNLPQEFGRDDRAISFVKGCYLGQETVARIDALGHVNQVLKGLAFESGCEGPAPGTILEADGQRAGVITSVASAPWRGQSIGLGMIRTSHATAGTRLQVAGPSGGAPAVATVVDLPFPPRA
jgi:folate-binding protein YgfZ